MAGRRLPWDVIAKGRPYLHPTLGHIGQNAPKKVLNALSGPDAGETVRRFARATRRQPVEHAGLIHPLSGRLMGMGRGHEGAGSTPVIKPTRSAQRLAELAEHHVGRYMEADGSTRRGAKQANHHLALAQRAQEAASRQGRIAGPRPILIHNHPTFHGTQVTRHMPSAGDLSITAAHRLQAKVVSLRPHTRRGEPKTHVTTFGHHGEPGRKTERHLGELSSHDNQTIPPSLIHRARQGHLPQLPIQTRGLPRAELADHQSTHAEDVAGTVLRARHARLSQAEFHRRQAGTGKGKRAMESRRRAQRHLAGSDYDTKVRAETKPKRKSKYQGFYTREETMKRYEGPRRVAPPAVGKRLVDEERRTSIPRLLAAGTGMGAIAWGGSRVKVLGRGLRLGASHPDIKVGIRRAFHTAELARAHTEQASRPLGAMAGRGFGHLPQNVRASLNNVPPGLRPATSALVGAIMVENARPVRRSTYRPVVMR